MPAEIITQRGVSIIPPSTDLFDVTLPTTLTDTTKSFARLISNSPFHMGPDAGTTGLFASNADMSAYISILNTTTLRIQSKIGLLAPARRVVWEVWEYVGAVGGPNEFIVRSNTGVVTVSDLGGVQINPWGTFPTTNNNNIVVFHRGLEWIAPLGNTANYQDSMIILSADVSAGFNFFRFLRGVNEPTENPIAHYSAVEFTGSNWRVQRITDLSPPVGTIKTTNITNVFDWSTAFIYSQRASTSNIDANIGMVAFPAVATNQFHTTYNANSIGGTFNSNVVMIISNPLMRVFHNNSVQAPGTGSDHVGTGPPGGLQQIAEPVTLLAPATSDSDPQSGAVFLSADSDQSTFNGPSSFWVAQLQSDGSGGDEILWARSRDVGTSRWAHSVVNLRFVETGSWFLFTREIAVSLTASGITFPAVSVRFNVTVTDPEANVAVIQAVMDAAVAAVSAPVTVAEATEQVTVAATGLPVVIGEAVIEVQQ